MREPDRSRLFRQTGGYRDRRVRILRQPALVKNKSSNEQVPADGKAGKIVVGASVLEVKAGAFANLGNEVIVYSIEKGAAAYTDGWNTNTKGLE